MAVLSTADRKAMPKSEFAGPDRSFPIPDKSHARAALSMEHNAPASARPKIEAMAHEKLGEKPGMSPAGDHKAAISKMHPEHLHKLVQAAHSGQYGPEAKQMASQAMQAPAGMQQDAQQPPMAAKSNPFADAGDEEGPQPAAPGGPGSMYGG